MKINLVNYEMSFNDGILSKYARKLKEHLELLEVETILSATPDCSADICHHINYLPYKPNSTRNTLMITHIFDGYKLDKIKEAMKTADIGICFSDDTKYLLINNGLNKDKLITILPAHDELPRKKKKILIVTNVYPDGCKRENMFYAIPRNDEFEFTIMGRGWKQAQYPEFDLEIYKKILPEHDYLLYFGLDEGAMSVLDAKQVGLKVIAPNVGFHRDLDVDYPFNNQEELNDIFKKLAYNPVKDWTWERYALNHKKIWEEIIKQPKED